MSDFPVADAHKPVISNLSLEAGGGMYVGVAVAGDITPTANKAHYVPFALRAPYLVRNVWWMNGAFVTNGHADVGVYTQDGTRLLSAGSTVTTPVSAIQKVTLGTAVLLVPGSYYMAMAGDANVFADGHSASVFGQESLLNGWATQVTALALPATFTLAQFALTVEWPTFGIASATTI